MQKEKVVIIGSGPAGLTAAIYTARAMLDPVVIVGDQLGGQIALSSEVENYPAFVDVISGFDLTDGMQKQATKFGARLDYDSVVSVDLSQGSPFHIKTHSKEYLTEALIITAGASPRKLGIPGEDDYWGRGVSTCATCDGFFYKGKKVVVIGGGDSAMEEGIFLTKFADSVTVIHRRDELRAGPVLQKRAFANEKMNFIWHSVVEAVLGDGQKVTGVRLRNVKTDAVINMDTDGFFLFIGHEPNSDIVANQVEMDDQGYVIADELMRTSIEGVFAAGEIQDPVFRQVATSVG
ncbi:MAG: thioredoxin-disulfide reductase, partial [Anaerolineales bacterium]|nr:thioredoxin-disulfide reductase [Anaerolineales bacterium]